MTDRKIKLALENGHLIKQGSWQPEFIRHATYTLRIGDRVELAHADNANTEEERRFERIDLIKGQSVDLRPGDTAKLYSIEFLDLPHSVLGLTVARGLMYIESLVPENTYVDPGFTGPLYTTVTNLSNRVIRLDYGDPVARLFFYNLSEEVEEPYRDGSSKSLKQRLNSVRATSLGTMEECRKAGRGDIIKELRQVPICGTQIATLFQREFQFMLWLCGIALLWPPLLLVANTNAWALHTIGRASSNLISIILSPLLSWILPYAWERLKKL